MANAGKDGNFVSTMIGLSTADGTTVLPVFAVAATHALSINDATDGTRTGDRAKHDQNHVATMTALSSAGDGTIVPLYVDSSNNGLLIQST